MLKELFSSQTRVKLLVYFFEHENEKFFMRELTREVGEQINSVRRELENLHSLGLLVSENHLNRKYYHLDKNFVIYQELKSIVQKTSHLESDLSQELEKLGDLKLIVLSGVFTGDTKSKVDLLVVGNLPAEKLERFLESRVGTIRYALLTEEDFNYRIQCRDKFILDILRTPANIFPLNRLSKKFLV